MLNKYDDWTNLYPNHVVIRKEEIYYTVRNESAQTLHELLGYKLDTCKEGIKITGCSRVEPILKALIANQINFIVIENNEIIHKREFEESNFKPSNTKCDFIHKNKKTLTANEEKDLKLLDFIDTLLLGIDPNTGEIFDDKDIMSCEYMKQILSLAHRKVKRNKSRPSLGGSRWTPMEDTQLKEEYEAHMSINEIAKIHNRSCYAIESRIVKIIHKFPNDKEIFMNDPNKVRAEKILQSAYGNNAKFRKGQLEAIVAVLERKKMLVVQKTGWGKSIVYFIATRILREDGAGPTIIISPLLALMKNQIDSANKLGIKAVTINSDNTEEHNEIYTKIDKYDAIIISPERLSNEVFVKSLINIKNIQLFVVDEAHSISDWGHDFRPDYQRIVKLLESFPAGIAILGTTATANERVIDDINRQFGNDLTVVRGDLIRENLAIQINPSQTKEERLAWLSQYLNNDNRFENKQGIIYCLTQRDCEQVAEFLRKTGVSVEAYHSGLEKDIAKERINRFDEGLIKILVATIKLGMGYDKSNIRFVIHYQLPQNLISYYQQIGRAGRDGEKAYAILLHGKGDEEILEHFIENAQAKPELLDEIMECTRDGAKLNEMLSAINVKYTKLLEALKYLMIHDYIYKDGYIYRRNITLDFNSGKEREKQKQINLLRQKELEKMKEFLSVSSCYMKFISDELDAPDSNETCQICKNCEGNDLVSLSIHSEYLKNAQLFIKKRHEGISPRKKWAIGGEIPERLRFKNGWILSDDYYSEIGQLVREGKYSFNEFSVRLVDVSKDYIKKSVVENKIDLVVAVPSLRRPDLVPDFAKSLANSLGIEFVHAVRKTQNSVEQKTLKNSAKQQKNIDDSIEIISDKIFDKTILLVDDMVDSKWSFTVIASRLLQDGAKAVYPFALVKTGNGD